jgi:hypothetical protein
MPVLKWPLLLISLVILSSCVKPTQLHPIAESDLYFIQKEGSRDVCFSQFYWENVVSKKTGMVIHE